MKYKEVNLRKAAGKVWKSSPRLLCEQLWAKQKTDWFNHSWSINLPKRFLLEKAIFKHFGKLSWIEPPLHVCSGKNISIGERCYFNFNTVLLDDCAITIGDHVLFGPNVTVVTAAHPIPAELRMDGETLAAPVVIEDGVWIGANATVLPGVRIGKGSVIGAGSVVTKDIPPSVVAVGVPCEVMREIDHRDRSRYR